MSTPPPQPTGTPTPLADDTAAEQLLRRLDDASASLSAALTEADVAAAVMGEVLPGMGADCGWIGVLDAEERGLRVAGLTGLECSPGQPGAGGTHIVSLDTHHLAVDAFQRAEMVLFGSRGELIAEYPERGPDGPESHAAVPVLAGGVAVGVFVMCFPQQHAFTTGERHYLAAIARHCGHALERVTLIERLRYERAVLQAQQEALNEGIMLVTGDNQLTVNRRFTEMFPTITIDERGGAGAIESFVEFARRELIDPERYIERVLFLQANPEIEALEEVLFLDGRVYERFSAPVTDEREYYGRIWFFRDVTSERRTERVLRDVRLREREAHKRLLEVEDRERFELACKLHDGPLQQLVAAAMFLEEGASNDSRENAMFQRGLRHLRDVIVAQRSFMQELHPDLLGDADISAGLARLAGVVSRDAVVDVRLPTDFATEHRELALMLFRIANELLANVRKHADSLLRSVTLHASETAVVLQVEDAGTSPWPDEPLPDQFGLSLVRHRAELCGGSMGIDHLPTGTCVRVWLPFE